MKPRVTTSDIARAADVHQTTVSLALRGDKRLRASTVARIRAVAEKLGYTPDPMLAALASYRHARRPSGAHGTLVWGTNWPTAEGWRLPMFVRFHAGAQQRAAELGYRLDEFWFRTPGLTPRRASEILHARGVLGLILAPQPDGVSAMDLEWARFSVVTIGPTLRQPELHLVSNSQFRTMQRLCRELAERGYRRIGYAIERKRDERMDGQWSAAFDRFQRDLPAARRTRRFEAAPTPAALEKWLRETRPDVVIDSEASIGRFLAARPVTADRPRVAFARIGLSEVPSPWAGMHEDAARIGAMAVERVAALIQLGDRGVPAMATRTLIDATWVDAAPAAE